MMKLRSTRYYLKMLHSYVRNSNIRRYFHFVLKGHFIRRVIIQRYSTKSKDATRCLQVGGGRHSIKETGWINGDIINGDIYLNATTTLPFPDNYFDAIFTEQFVEHISIDCMHEFTKECYRVLKPGGVIRHTTPNLPLLFDVYLDKNKKVSREDAINRLVLVHSKDKTLLTPAEFINAKFRWWGHQFIYDYETLALVYDNAGFKHIQEAKFHVSRLRNLSFRERHFDSEWMKDAYQLTVEAQKT